MIFERTNDDKIIITPEDGDCQMNLSDLVAFIANTASLDVTSVTGPEYLGNDYAGYIVTNAYQGNYVDYFVGPDDLETLQEANPVTLEPYGMPQFTLPRYYKFSNMVDRNGVRGTMFWLEKEPTDEQKQQMKDAGCSLAHSRPEYAPEIIHACVFVPDGIDYDYE